MCPKRGQNYRYPDFPCIALCIQLVFLLCLRQQLPFALLISFAISSARRQRYTDHAKLWLVFRFFFSFSAAKFLFGNFYHLLASVIIFLYVAFLFYSCCNVSLTPTLLTFSSAFVQCFLVYVYSYLLLRKTFGLGLTMFFCAFISCLFHLTHLAGCHTLCPILQNLSASVIHYLFPLLFYW